MPLFRRRPPYVSLRVPAPGGQGWPSLDDVGRPSFASSTYYEIGCRHAYDDEAHDLAARLVDAVMPHLPTGVDDEDEPYLRKVFVTAARIGAGIGTVERTLPTPDARSMDRRIAAALWQARRKLPAMPPAWTDLAAYVMLAGYYLARTDVRRLPALVEELGAQPGGGSGPGQDARPGQSA